jgi:hypothetical protein
MSLNEIEIKKWVTRGSMVINTEALNHDDPMHPYNQALAQGVDPADFGIEHPLNHRFKGKSRGDLINEIIELEKELSSFYMFLNI